VNYGSTRKAEPDEIRDDAWVLELEDIEKDTSRVLQRVEFARRRSKSTKNRFDQGDILYGKLRPYLNKVVRANEAGYCSTEIVPLTPPVGLDGRYLFYWLKNPRFLEHVTSVSHGLNMPRLGTDAGRAAPFLLAPLLEQTRIADKLDSLLARVDACRARLDRVPEILKRFRQSVLGAATSGELTREWREARGLHVEWELTSVANVAAKVFDGPFGSHLKSKDYVNAGVRVVRLENIAPLRFVEEKQTYITREKYESLTKHTLFAGDIIFSSFVDEEVRVCLLPAQLDANAINKADCFCIRTNPQYCRPRFLMMRLACKSTFDSLEDVVHGVTRPRINLGQLKEISFELPSLDEQDEIVRRSSALFDLADALERHFEAARDYVERATSSSLAKAFRGELVPQNPSDEPAAELLVKIKAEQSTATAERARRHTTIKRKRTDMSDTGKDAIREAILKLKARTFSFEDLRTAVSADYESLKAAVFELLEGPEPIIRQVFNKKAEAIHFERVSS
jgi:type I restriction enzyme S subunit